MMQPWAEPGGALREELPDREAGSAETLWGTRGAGGAGVAERGAEGVELGMGAGGK